jgi:hypothetical protein
LSHDVYLRVYVSYKNSSEAIEQDFLNIEEQFCSEHRNYCIGIIPLKNLYNSAWFYDQRYSTILVSIPEDLDIQVVGVEYSKQVLEEIIS